MLAPLLIALALALAGAGAYVAIDSDWLPSKLFHQAGEKDEGGRDAAVLRDLLANQQKAAEDLDVLNQSVMA